MLQAKEVNLALVSHQHLFKQNLQKKNFFKNFHLLTKVNNNQPCKAKHLAKTDSFKFWKAILHFIIAKLTNHIFETSHWDMLNTVLQSLFKNYNNLVSKIRESTLVTSVSSEIPSFLNCSSKLNIANQTLMPMLGESYDLTMCHQY